MQLLCVCYIRLDLLLASLHLLCPAFRTALRTSQFGKDPLLWLEMISKVMSVMFFPTLFYYKVSILPLS